MGLKENLERLQQLTPRGRGGRRRRSRQEAARAGTHDRARAGRVSARPRIVRRARQVQDASNHRLRDGREENPRRRRRDRLRHDRRPPGVHLQPRFHRLRRQPVGRVRGESLQGDGPRHEDRMPRDRAQRRQRRANPGRRRIAGGLRGYFSAQRDVVGSDSADFRNHGTVRGRRGVFAGDNRLHRDGARHVVHVPHRARRDQSGHA